MKLLCRRAIIGIISITLLFGAWWIGAHCTNLVNLYYQLANTIPNWLIVWTKGVIIIVSSLVVLGIFLIAIIMGIALLLDKRTKEEKERDEYYGRL